MKYINSIVCKLFVICLTVCLLFSCAESDDEIIDAALCGLVGRIPYESIIWQGDAIDFNDSGEMTTDLFKGFEGKSNAQVALSRGIYVDRPYALNDPTAIHVTIPVQSLIFNKTSNSYDWMNQSALIAHMILFYSVDKNGHLSFDVTPNLDRVDDYYREDKYEIRCPDMGNTVNGEVISMGDGVLKIKITACYLDWSTNELVSDDIILTCRQ